MKKSYIIWFPVNSPHSGQLSFTGKAAIMSMCYSTLSLTLYAKYSGRHLHQIFWCFSNARSGFFFFYLGWKDVSSSIINAIFNIHICIFSDSQVCNVCHFNETQSLIFPAHLNLITMISVMVSHIFTSFHNNLYFPPTGVPLPCGQRCVSDRVSPWGAGPPAVTHDEPLPNQAEGDTAATSLLHSATRGSHIATDEAGGG